MPVGAGHGAGSCRCCRASQHPGRGSSHVAGAQLPSPPTVRGARCGARGGTGETSGVPRRSRCRARTVAHTATRFASTFKFNPHALLYFSHLIRLFIASDADCEHVKVSVVLVRWWRARCGYVVDACAQRVTNVRIGAKKIQNIFCVSFESQVNQSSSQGQIRIPYR